MTQYSTLQNKNGNTDPRSRIMMPQSSLECLMRGTEEHILETFTLYPVNHKHFCC